MVIILFKNTKREEGEDPNTLPPSSPFSVGIFTERPPGLFLAGGGYLALLCQFGYLLQSRMGTGPPPWTPPSPSPQTQQLALGSNRRRPEGPARPLRSRPALGLVLPLPLWQEGVLFFSLHSSWRWDGGCLCPEGGSERRG